MFSLKIDKVKFSVKIVKEIVKEKIEIFFFDLKSFIKVFVKIGKMYEEQSVKILKNVAIMRFFLLILKLGLLCFV